MGVLSKTGSGRLLGSFGNLLKLVLIATGLALLALYIIALPLGLELFLFGNLSDTYSPSYPVQVKLWFTQIEVSVGHIFVSAVLLYGLCFALAFGKTKGFRKHFMEYLQKPLALPLKDSLLALPVLSSLTYVAVTGVHWLERLFAIPIGGPPLPEDALLAYHGLTIAPLTEELTYRILPIGVFLAARFLSINERREPVASRRGRLKTIFTVFVSPDGTKEMLGLKTIARSGFRGGTSHDEWLMILFTSIFFALSHYFFTGTWMVGKIASTFVQGLVMGLSYLAYGFHAPILIHWFFNYYLATYSLAAVVHPGVSAVSLLSEKLALGLAILGIPIAVYSIASELVKTKSLSSDAMFFPVAKVRDKIAEGSRKLLHLARGLRSFDLAVLAMTLTLFFMRLAIINIPGPEPGERYYDTGFVFDESYYVRAARKMLVGEGSNNEHPPLSKTFIMLGIILFGDSPIGWRIFPIIASSASIILVYRITFLLNRSKMASFFAALLFGTDTIVFNLGQIGMLDAPSMLFLLAGCLLLLMRKSDLGGTLLGLASLCKLSAAFASAGIVLFLMLSSLFSRGKSSSHLTEQLFFIGRVFLAALATFLVGLWIYDAAYGVFSSNPLEHVVFFYRYHDSLRYQDPTEVILPLEWINPLNPFPPTPYHVTTVREISSSGVWLEYHPIAYYGIYTPLWWSIWILMPLGLAEVIRKVHNREDPKTDVFALLWITANFLPYVLLGYLMQRWVYPFYFYLALPGLYIGSAHYLTRLRHSKLPLAVLALVQVLWFFVWFSVKPKAAIDLLLSLGLPA